LSILSGWNAAMSPAGLEPTDEGNGMRLATYERDGTWRGAVAVGPALVDAEAAVQRIGVENPAAFGAVRALVAQPRDWLYTLERAAQSLLEDQPEGTDVVTEPILGPPIPDPQKILCVGLNYREHAAEAGANEPTAPVIFAKFANSLIGAGAPVVPPRGYSTQIDYEGELAVVLGKRAYDMSADETLDAIAGWMPFNDVTARDLQMQTTQWTIGKSPDTFGPCGPHLVIDDAIAENAFEISTFVNGDRVQHTTTDQMIFSIVELVSFVSRVLTLLPGDVIVTGTPSGVGVHSSPPRFLQDGDVVEVRVNDERLSNPVQARVAQTA
jgi:acylpyruvate hydrolase